jgi:barstar (barnase inhibitor)
MAQGASEVLAAEHSGVYRTPRLLAPVREATATAKCAWIEMDLAAVADKAGLLAAFAAALAFPSTFGNNWDALADSLQDLSWRQERGSVMHLGGAEALARVAPRDWAIALEILAASATYWKEKGTVFIVLADGVAGLPEFGR